MNHKRIYRLYRLDGLVIRQKTPRPQALQPLSGRLDITAANQTWAMDFVSDTLFNGTPIRILTVVDCHTRESISVEPRAAFLAYHVVEARDRIAAQRGLPKTIRCDNGPEFAGRVLDQWAFFNHVELDFSRPATPTDNAYIESLKPACARSCSTLPGFCRWLTPEPGWRHGGRSTTRRDHTLH